MIVVCNTSPLTNLAAIGQFDLLAELYGEIHIPAAVWAELNARDVYWPGREEVASAEWIYRHEIQNVALAISLQRDLDRGEAESIALALELEAGLLLMDERDGRRSAKRLGLNTVGVVGVLLEAKAKNLAPLIRPLLDALRLRAGFYLSEAVYQAALALAGEV